MSNRFVNRLFATCLALLLMVGCVYAQTWYRVDAVTGQQTVAFNTVTVSPQGSTGSWGPYCAWDLNYLIGQTDTGYFTWSFSKPVRAVRFRTAVSNVSERLRFFINGVHYNVVAPILDTFPTGCPNYSTKPVGDIDNGDLVCPATTNLYEQVVYIEPGYSINTAAIRQTGTSLGTIFDFNFSYDYSYVAIKQPFADTLLCVGDSLLVPYTALAMFDPGNVFTTQLSDANGSFSNAVNIGSLTSTMPDTIRCKIPLTTIPGTKYRIRILSTNRKDTSATNGIDIKISDFPKPVAISNSPVCEGTVLNMSASSTTPVSSFTWMKTGQPSIVAQSIMFPNAPLSLAGDYIVEAEYNGCKGRDTVTVVIIPRPAPPTINSNSPVCPNDTLFLSATGVSGATYQWIGPGGFASASKDTFIANFTIAQQGYYYARTKVNSCLSLPDSVMAIEGEVPKLVASNNGPLCSGSQLVLSVKDTAVPSINGLHFTWSGPGGYTDTSKTGIINNITTSKAGRYIIAAIKNNCSDTDTTFVTVIQTPPKPQLSSNSPICEGKELQLKATDSLPGLSYNWKGPSGFNVPSADPVITNAGLNASGIYTVTVNNDGCTSEDTISVKVKPVIVPQISSNSPVPIGGTIELYIKDPVSGVNYNWDGPNGFASNLPSPVIIDAAEKHTGSYTATAILDGCIGSSITIVQVVETDTGIFHLYPNPNDGNFKIKILAAKDQPVRIRIYSQWGQLMYSEQIQTIGKKLQKDISLPSAASGIYYLRSLVDGKDIAIPFVISPSR